jgi:hypothetical protein
MEPKNSNNAALANRGMGSVLAWILGWLWAIIAGGGGLWLLWTSGPGKLTNGWFALCSGLSACPLTAWFLKKAGISVPGWVQLVLAVIFFVAGKIALKIGI